MLGIVIIQDSLDGLLDLSRRHAFVVLSSPLRHVEIELQDIVELVPGVHVSQSLSDS